MKVRCIKEYIYDLKKRGDVEEKLATKGLVYETEPFGYTKFVVDDTGNCIISFDDERFDEYFEFICDEMVNHPKHYQGEMETIDIIEYVLSDINSKHTFALGNIIKYCNRANRKGGKEDLEKAKWYAERLLNG